MKQKNSFRSNPEDLSCYAIFPRTAMQLLTRSNPFCSATRSTVVGDLAGEEGETAHLSPTKQPKKKKFQTNQMKLKSNRVELLAQLTIVLVLLINCSLSFAAICPSNQDSKIILAVGPENDRRGVMFDLSKSTLPDEIKTISASIKSIYSWLGPKLDFTFTLVHFSSKNPFFLAKILTFFSKSRGNAQNMILKLMGAVAICYLMGKIISHSVHPAMKELAFLREVFELYFKYSIIQNISCYSFLFFL